MTIYLSTLFLLMKLICLIEMKLWCILMCQYFLNPFLWMLWIFLDNVGCCAVSSSILVIISCVSSHTVYIVTTLRLTVLTLRLLGGGHFEPPPCSFLHFTTKISPTTYDETLCKFLYQLLCFDLVKKIDFRTF